MLIETLIALERSLHDAAVRTSPEKIDSLLHPAFREVGRSGAVYTRSEIIEHLISASKQPRIWAQDFVLDVLADDIALLTYRSAHLDESGKLQRQSVRASIWQLTDKMWKMRFHQGTAIPPFEMSNTLNE